MIIHVKDYLKSDIAFSSTQGRLIRDAIGDAWTRESVSVDFAGIRNISPSFLSQSLMPILENFPLEMIDTKISFLSAPNGFEFAWENVMRAMRERRARGLT